MFKETIEQMKTALLLLFILTVLTGLLYPITVTGLAELLFPVKANGSLIRQNDKIIGSRFIGQSFSSPIYFWSRPSATNPYPYNGASSAGSNFGPTNTRFLSAVKERISQLKQADTQNIPVDLVTASASGLDPEISPLAAFYQASRIAKASNISLEDLKNLIQKHVQNRSFGILGEPRINVLELNLALNSLRNNHGQTTPES